MSEIKDYLKEMFDCFMEDVQDILLPVLGLISLVLVLIVGISVLLVDSQELTCAKKADAQRLEWSYEPLEGCMVKTENGWLDYDKLIYKKEVK